MGDLNFLRHILRYLKDQYSGGRDKIFKDAELKHYLVKIRVKIRNWNDYWEQLDKQFLNDMSMIEKQVIGLGYELKSRDLEQRVLM